MSRDTSFYYSFLVLPSDKRRAMIAVWDFCRAVDDSVDEIAPDAGVGDGPVPTAALPGEHGGSPAPPLTDGPARVEGGRAAGEQPQGASRGPKAESGLSPQMRARAAGELAGWRGELDAIYSGTPGTAQGQALLPHVRRFSLPRQQFDELVDGVEMDLDRAHYQTFPELLEYCRRVASAVGLICVEIFGYRDAATRDYAVDLGIALQLTNIIRDVAADLDKGRVYLPADDLARFGVSRADLRAGVVTPPVRALLRFECDRARTYYQRAASSLPAADAGSLVAAEIMGAIYFAILRRIEHADYDVFSRRIRVPRPARAIIALGVWARTLARALPGVHGAMPDDKRS